MAITTNTDVAVFEVKDQPKSLFFTRLPVELRLHIYGLAFHMEYASDHLPHSATVRDRLNFYSNRWFNVRDAVDSLMSCKLMYVEAMQVFVETNEFRHTIGTLLLPPHRDSQLPLRLRYLRIDADLLSIAISWWHLRVDPAHLVSVQMYKLRQLLHVPGTMLALTHVRSLHIHIEFVNCRVAAACALDFIEACKILQVIREVVITTTKDRIPCTCFTDYVRCIAKDPSFDKKVEDALKDAVQEMKVGIPV